MDSPRNVHFIGIGGIGMSALARLLHDLGHMISGSDLGDSQNTRELQSRGMTVHKGHDAKNVQGADVVIHSTAIKGDNPELVEAQMSGRPVLGRGQLLGQLMLLKKGVAIAGTHGKTTTTGLTSYLLKRLNFDPTYIVGGMVPDLGLNAGLGQGELLVTEADESDGSFLQLNPTFMAVTNIDTDHLDYFGDEASIEKHFLRFMQKTPFFGGLVVNQDDPWLGRLIPQLNNPITFSLKSDATYQAKNCRFSNGGSNFDLYVRGELVDRVELSLMGEHNVQNTLTALALVHLCGADLKKAIPFLKDFKGVGRRLELITTRENLAIYDDYAHHPTEILASSSALRSQFPKHYLMAVFEPHRFTRTQACWDELLECWGALDQVLLAPIYAASESPIPGIDSANLAKAMKAKGINAVALSELSEIHSYIGSHGHEVLVSMGAGTIGRNVRELFT